MNLNQRAGQLMMVGVPANDPVGGYTELVPYAVGGVFLAGRSSAGAEVVGAAVTTLQVQGLNATGTFLHVAADQEGGLVQTLSGPGFSPIPDGVEQGRLSTTELASQTAIWAGELAGAGITFNLAPVADTVPAGTGAANPPIGASDRQYGDDPQAVAAAVSTVVTTLQGAGVDATIKHFPGLGRVTANTDTSTRAEDEQTTVDDITLQPFSAGIQAGATAVMMSSASYPQLDPLNLAAFSPAVIGDLLRDQLGFTGVVVSDDLGNAVAVADIPLGERAVDFVAAGGDLVLTVDGADAEPMTSALIARAVGDQTFAARIDESALRVLVSKQDSGLLVCG
ncbi:MAG: glycoside hydrolase family 3 protein [Actinomycetota bacterium]|nr:glycoside hydrolase family 3 protein [Geodermatophilaceae bacterium]MDQ3504437.1 glycoside hydrolase family 3 protein [Actinomycetota bacterium]